MNSRRQVVLDAAIRVLATSGMHGLTHRAVDREGRLPEGATSNVFRTRSALIAALAAHIADWRLNGVHDTSTNASRAWLELLLEAQRSANVAESIAPLRERMIARLSAQRTDRLPFTDTQLAALLTGLEFAESVTGESVSTRVLELLETASAASA